MKPEAPAPAQPVVDAYAAGDQAMRDLALFHAKCEESDGLIEALVWAHGPVDNWTAGAWDDYLNRVDDIEVRARKRVSAMFGGVR